MTIILKRFTHNNSLSNILRTRIVVNLLGDRKSVDTASWEIYSFGQEKLLQSANIVYDGEIIKSLLLGNNILQFIVNRCYNTACYDILRINNNIINTNVHWKPYNLYVMPNATSFFENCDFINYCRKPEILLYPLAATPENKREHIHAFLN